MKGLLESYAAGTLPPRLANILAQDEVNHRYWLSIRRKRLRARIRAASAHPGLAAKVSLIGGWWEGAPPLLPPSGRGGRPRKAAAWRSATEQLKVQFAHYVLLERGEVMAFALRLDDAIRKQALAASRRTNAGARSFLAKRIDYRLRRTFKKAFDYWFILEVTSRAKNDLHLHGELDLSGVSNRRLATKALRLAGGEFDPDPRRWQAYLSRTPDSHNIGYLSKDRDNAVRFARLARRGFSSFSRLKGNGWEFARVKITSKLSKDAEALYVAARPLVALA